MSKLILKLIEIIFYAWLVLMICAVVDPDATMEWVISVFKTIVSILHATQDFGP